nr:response regulator transcription factor [Paenibacillus turpanensis]
MRSACRMVVIDDHQHAREAVSDIISAEPAFELVAEGRSGYDALELAEKHLPDLMLMDIQMPGMSGLEATKHLKERYPAMKIVIMTVSDDVADLFEAIKRGAQGYLVKSVHSESWLDYLRAVAVDDTPMSTELAMKLLAEFTGKARRNSRAVPETALTEREMEILQHVAEGLSNKETAQALYITENTVKNHLKNILQKLHLENRVQLARYAYEQGLLKSNEN